MAIRKRPYGDGAREFNRLWDAGSHQDKLDLCQKYGISYQTGKDWRIFAIDELPQNRIVSDKQPIINLSPIKLKPYEPIMVGRGDPETQVLVLGDGHADEITPTYNAGIYQKRVNTLYQRLLAITHLHRNMYPLNDLVILDVGDNVHGENPYQGATIGGVSMGAVDQVYELALPTIIELLVNLRQEFKSIKFYGVRGNHGRISRISPSTSNFDLMLYKALSQTKLPAGIEINYSDDFYIMPIIEGFRFFVFHGDQCRATMGVPYFAMTRKIMSWYNTFGGNIPYFVCGHFHKEDYLRISSNTKLLMNGSLVSDDPYALEVVGTSSVPNYWTFGCHKNRGITWLYALMLDKATLPKGI